MRIRQSHRHRSQYVIEDRGRTYDMQNEDNYAMAPGNVNYPSDFVNALPVDCYGMVFCRWDPLKSPVNVNIAGKDNTRLPFDCTCKNVISH